MAKPDKMTNLVIAHRLSTIRNAAKIAVITDEGIQQQGSRQEFLEEGGLYADLYAAQFEKVNLKG